MAWTRDPSDNLQPMNEQVCSCEPLEDPPGPVSQYLTVGIICQLEFEPGTMAP